MVQKSRDAFRTISEVADWLDVPTHVLRFWESRFSQIKPVKRAGGRRYYRPSDMRVIGGVKTLLHDQGMTIRGVQKLFREEGIKHVSSYSPRLHGETGEVMAPPDADVIDATAEPAVSAPPARSSRDAVPDPVIDEAPRAAEAEPEDEAAAPVFAHRSAPAADKPVPDEDKAEPLPDLVDAMTAAPEPEAPRPTIPDTPDVPDSDPADDAAEFARGPSVAARLRLVDAAAMDANRADLIAAAEKLRAFLERAH